MNEVVSIKRIIQILIIPYLAACLPFCIYIVINKYKTYFNFSHPNSVHWYISILDDVLREPISVILYGWTYIFPGLLLGNWFYKRFFKNKGLIIGMIGFAVIGYVYTFLFFFFGGWLSSSDWNETWKTALYFDGFHPFSVLGSIAAYLVRRRFV